MELIADKIEKKIHGKTILNDISLRLSSGNVYGFVGRNGSGKTMLFRALSGLMTVDKGNGREKSCTRIFPCFRILGLYLKMQDFIRI